MSAFDIRSQWLQTTENAASELAATLARLQIFVGKRNITEHKTPRSKKTETALEVPTYYLAEWLAENWWVLLFEPRKDEDSDDSEYFTRHSIIAAQGGFPLPDLSIVPVGRGFHLNSSPRAAPFANIRFTTDVFADVPRDVVEQALREFVDDTVKRLSTCGVTHTDLQDVWNEIASLTDEERGFCELVGSLGLCPGDVTSDLGDAIERIYNLLGPRATRDFCLAATGQMVEASVRSTEIVHQHLQEAPDTALERLLDVQLPPENYHAPSWRRGKRAAQNVREKFGIDIKDPRGADIVFERLQLDTSRQTHVPTNNNFTPPFTGAIDRHEGTAKVALLQPDELRRRFSAGRAAYLGWVSEAQSRRLVTNAVTRDQQASRSFAAEILIPQAYLKSLAGPKGELHDYQVREAARSRRVMPEVAFKQAYNAGIRVGAI